MLAENLGEIAAVVGTLAAQHAASVCADYLMPSRVRARTIERIERSLSLREQPLDWRVVASACAPLFARDDQEELLIVVDSAREREVFVIDDRGQDATEESITLDVRDLDWLARFHGRGSTFFVLHSHVDPERCHASARPSLDDLRAASAARAVLAARGCELVEIACGSHEARLVMLDRRAIRCARRRARKEQAHAAR